MNQPGNQPGNQPAPTAPVEHASFGTPAPDAGPAAPDAGLAAPAAPAAPVVLVAPASGAETATPDGPTVSPAGWGVPAGFGAGASTAARPGSAQRRQAAVLFGVSVALIAAGLVTVFASLQLIWTGAFIAALAMLARSVVAYRGSVRSGASSVAKDRPLLVGAAIVLVGCLVGGVLAVGKYTADDKDANASTGVGSCWREADGSNLVPVDCSHDHQYVGSTIVSDQQDCDDAAVGWVASDDNRVLCLDPS